MALDKLIDSARLERALHSTAYFVGALMAYIGHGAQTLSMPTQRKKLSNKVWIPQFIK